MTYCLVSFLVDGVSVSAFAMLRDMLRSKSFSSRKMGGPSLAINQPRRMLQHPVAPCMDSLGSGSVLPSLPGMAACRVGAPDWTFPAYSCDPEELFSSLPPHTHDLTQSYRSLRAAVLFGGQRQRLWFIAEKDLIGPEQSDHRGSLSIGRRAIRAGSSSSPTMSGLASILEAKDFCRIKTNRGTTGSFQ